MLERQILDTVKRSPIGMYPLHIADALNADVGVINSAVAHLIACGALAERRYSRRLVIKAEMDEIPTRAERRSCARKQFTPRDVYEALCKRGPGKVSLNVICKRIGVDYRGKRQRESLKRSLRRLREKGLAERVGPDIWCAVLNNRPEKWK